MTEARDIHSDRFIPIKTEFKIVHDTIQSTTSGLSTAEESFLNALETIWMSKIQFLRDSNFEGRREDFERRENEPSFAKDTPNFSFFHTLPRKVQDEYISLREEMGRNSRAVTQPKKHMAMINCGGYSLEQYIYHDDDIVKVHQNNWRDPYDELRAFKEVKHPDLALCFFLEKGHRFINFLEKRSDKAQTLVGKLNLRKTNRNCLSILGEFIHDKKVIDTTTHNMLPRKSFVFVGRGAGILHDQRKATMGRQDDMAVGNFFLSFQQKGRNMQASKIVDYVQSDMANDEQPMDFEDVNLGECEVDDHDLAYSDQSDANKYGVLEF